MRKLLRIVVPALALASTAASPGGAMAQEVTFTKLLDSDTPIPGGDGTFGPITGVQDGEPVVAMDRDGNLAFAAGGRVFAVIDGQLHHTSAPGSKRTQVAIDGRRVAFGVRDNGGERLGGIFRWEPGTAPIEIAGAQTLVPGSDLCVFWTGEEGVSDWRFTLDGDAILFFGRGSADRGTDCDRIEGTFLWWNGSIEYLSDSPGASIDAGLVAFHRDGVIYAKELGQAPTRIVGPGDPVPGRSAFFDALGSVEVAAGRIAFRGRDQAGRWGLYLWEGGTLSVLAEEGADLPGDHSLDFLQGFRLGVDRVAVVGRDSRGQLFFLKSLQHFWERIIDESELHVSPAGVSEFVGDQLVLPSVYVVRADGGSLFRVLESGDMLEGRRLARVRPGALGRDEVLLVVEFEGSPTDHLYVAQLPPIAVDIDVKPHRASNRVHPRSRRSVSVAILGSETFPVEDMDVSTLRVGPDAAPTLARPKLRDVNGDGWIDLLLRFRQREAGIARGDPEICLSGETHEGVAFEGCDAVRTRHAWAAPSR